MPEWSILHFPIHAEPFYVVMITAGLFYSTEGFWALSNVRFRIPGVFTGQGAALLFDANKQPKPAYYAVADALAAATIQGVCKTKHCNTRDRN